MVRPTGGRLLNEELGIPSLVRNTMLQVDMTSPVATGVRVMIATPMATHTLLVSSGFVL